MSRLSGRGRWRCWNWTPRSAEAVHRRPARCHRRGHTPRPTVGDRRAARRRWMAGGRGRCAGASWPPRRGRRGLTIPTIDPILGELRTALAICAGRHRRSRFDLHGRPGRRQRFRCRLLGGQPAQTGQFSRAVTRPPPTSHVRGDQPHHCSPRHQRHPGVSAPPGRRPVSAGDGRQINPRRWRSTPSLAAGSSAVGAAGRKPMVVLLVDLPPTPHGSTPRTGRRRRPRPSTGSQAPIPAGSARRSCRPAVRRGSPTSGTDIQPVAGGPHRATTVMPGTGFAEIALAGRLRPSACARTGTSTRSRSSRCSPLDGSTRLTTQLLGSALGRNASRSIPARRGNWRHTPVAPVEAIAGHPPAAGSSLPAQPTAPSSHRRICTTAGPADRAHHAGGPCAGRSPASCRRLGGSGQRRPRSCCPTRQPPPGITASMLDAGCRGLAAAAIPTRCSLSAPASRPPAGLVRAIRVFGDVGRRARCRG